MNNTAYFHYKKMKDALSLASLRIQYDKHKLDEVQLKKQDGKCFKCREDIPDIDEAFYQPVRLTLHSVDKVAGIVLCPRCYLEQKAARING